MKNNNTNVLRDCKNSDTPLIKAENYGKKYIGEVDRSGQRQAFHFSPPVGWMNDPNGFSFYSGRIQLFYQYNPYSNDWNTMHWGHASSKDFVKWEHEQVALAPDMPYDGAEGGGCFSGSAIEFNGKYWLVYTGVGYDDKIGKFVQTQCVAYSDDGIAFTKYADNPVIALEKGLPAGSRPTDFRDPKVWEHDGYVYMIVSAGNEADEFARLLLYRTQNMTEWQCVGTAYSTSAETQSQSGTMMECPDLFRLDGTDVIIACSMNIPKHRNGNGCVYFTGKLDYETGKLLRADNSAVREVDGGFDFYAPQTMLHPDGRRILIAWMHGFGKTIGSLLGYRYASSQTFPRELHVENGTLRQLPVREIENYYRSAVVVKKLVNGDRLFVPELDGTCMNLSLEFAPSEGAGITVFADKNGKGLQIYYSDGKVYLNRRDVYSSDYPESALIASVPAPLVNGKIKIRALLDRISAEVFVGDGQYAMTANVATTEDHFRTALYSKGKVEVYVVKNEIVVA